jgi:DNA-binding NarL/FixJ family response regulator
MPRHTIPWTDSEVATLTAMNAAGKSDAEIARKLRRTEKMVTEKLRRLSPEWVTRRNLPELRGFGA